MIPFNKPAIVGTELKYIETAMLSNKLCGDGGFTKKACELMEAEFQAHKVLLTPSCTASLELAALLLDLDSQSEVIIPSYTFVSTANAFALRGAKIKFVDVDPLTMNLDLDAVEQAITPNTKVIVPVHYAGTSCDMDRLMSIAKKYAIWVVEDAAQGVNAKYKDKYLGTIGHIGCYSFHETKNYTSGGEGGAIVINSQELVERAEIIREKGTNRAQMFRGQVDKYTWQDIGSSYLPSEIQAAYLYAQLECLDLINKKRLYIWDKYYAAFNSYVDSGKISLPSIPKFNTHNAHMFFLKFENIDKRTDFILHCKDKNIISPFHYIPLHSSPAGKRLGELTGEDLHTTKESEKLVRLPLYFNMNESEIDYIIEVIRNYLESH
ncbi:dTDP-4-amino-4,6-dideoxygalactose transaminase [Pseudoalteromonas fenneropenaei]|uniref:dTDP-4-amino-4,6-dideoxygalactose transaminase n=1 Tax=Pseudoalteromonas fenneropenaei TaxID=1737459 RepID=A0ABV7CKC3_9GAMM